MGQTLENGVYLPSEGERNCYAGLKTNWEILDQKVADVTALQQAVAGALHREIVESLPTTDIDPNTIYMVLSGTSATENVYNEYMYVNNAWELIGTSATDLTNYYTKAEVDGKLLLKANASDLTSHTGDTTIHVTASDKTKWTNSANTHVLRLALSALTPSTSDNSFSNLDDATALKVGDKVMDTAGVLFEVTAIDTQNSTFTIGTALIDLAQDSDVVHKSGDETIGGIKTFSDDIIRGLTTIASRTIKGNGNTPAIGSNGVGFIQNKATLTYADSTPTKEVTVTLEIQDSNYTDGRRSAFFPNSNNGTNLGKAGKRWASVYATNYYYGGSEIEFSQKFVTTDTAQTISGRKTFEGVDINLKSSISEYGVSGGGLSTIYSDKNSVQLAQIKLGNYTTGTSYEKFSIYAYDSNNQQVDTTITFSWSSLTKPFIRPDSNNLVSLGTSGNKWKDTCTNLINGVEPSSLSLPCGNLTEHIDISSYFSNTENTNSYTASANGWIYLRLGNISSCQATVYDANNNRMWGQSVTGSVEQITIPILKGQTLTTQWATTSTVNVDTAKFIPCQGNV